MKKYRVIIIKNEKVVATVFSKEDAEKLARETMQQGYSVRVEEVGDNATV